MGKLYDLAVKTDTYTAQDGTEKAKWQNVGAVMEGRDGGQFILLEKWFNPAGVVGEDGRTSVMISCFDPQRSQQGGQQQGGFQNQGQHQAQGGFGGQQQAPQGQAQQQGFQGQHQGGYNGNPQR